MTYTGPFISSSVSQRGSTRFEKTAWRYRQPRPYHQPLPYSAFNYVGSGESDGYWACRGLESLSSVQWTDLETLAYDRLHSKIGEQANLALTLLEVHKSSAMIASRVSSLLGAVRELRRGNIPGVFRRLLVDPKRSSPHRIREISRINTKDPASAWLEFTFGWVPLVQDIYAASSVMSQDFGSTRVRAAASSSVSHRRIEFWGDSSLPSQESSYTLKRRVGTQVSVRITNPNLLLARQLGFVNPAYVAWDAVPFSFVVDWFLPVGKFLNSFTNEVGMELLGAQVGRKVSIVDYIQKRNDFPGQALAVKQEGHAESFFRSLGALPRPSLLDRARLPSANLWLIATSVALLRQNLLKLVK